MSENYFEIFYKFIYFITSSNDFGVAVKQPRLALGSAAIVNSLFNSSETFCNYKIFIFHRIYFLNIYFLVPYSPPDNFSIKPVDSKHKKSSLYQSK